MLVKIIIPFYKLPLRKEEHISLLNTMNIFQHYPIAFIKPKDLDISFYEKLFPKAEIINVSNNWLGTKRKISGYNDMMRSKAFYDLFSNYKYILICHTDTWIFRDEITEWCQRGYDVLAAPWPMHKKYGRFPLKEILWLRRILTKHTVIMHQDKYNHIGNGGLSLRKVSSFQKACTIYQKEIIFFNKQTNVHYGEDLFWAIVPKDFHYPKAEDALQFAFDSNPALCYQLNKKQIPMGCHGFNHGDKKGFWMKFIPCLLEKYDS